eukprot:TRINITY_DN62223_c0_g1_i2.p1 TRINITY_DN62223_c0_g1~~TRINITY_DN62223_c0_g1_i2.p1  ORF type:complete len:312 (+),score=67.27 TRINITY_DN62223_c0_g1_i2:572-1507(+)
MVTQWSKENWTEAQVSLSTAKPNLGGTQPELQPWRIHLMDHYQPSTRSSRSHSGLMPQMATNMMMQQMVPCMEQQIEVFDDYVSEAAPMASTHAEVTAGASSATFHCNGKHTVKNDREAVKIPIMQQTFMAHFRYSCVPKLAERAYLKARIINNTEFQFLAGSANVFLDNYFVAKTEQSLVAPGQDWWVYLGVDEAITVKHKLLKRKEADVKTMLGAGKGKKKIEYDYKLEITNNKATQEEIVVWDQVPIASNKDVVVTVLEPEYKHNTETLKKNDVDFFEWFLYLKKGEKQVIPFRFTVEYPADKNISGL